MMRIAGRVVLTLALAGCSFTAGRGAYEQTYLPAGHNWVFRELYPDADHLFNAFDYGHAILYETLLSRRDRAALDGSVLRHVTMDVLGHPPAVPLEERAIGPTYAKLIPEVLATFEWAHMLHRQLYDILGDPRIAPDVRDVRVAQVLAYYRSRPDLALSASPKGMILMEQQPYSLVFRREAPRYNALIWSYHWFQMTIYDALLASEAHEQRAYDISARISHFWQMVYGAAPAPSVMPMSAAVAPVFTDRYPEAAIVFDNLHSLHDVISDILASQTMSRAAMRRAALAAAAVYRDSTTAVTSRADWLEMSRMMGVENMGGRTERPIAP